MNGRSGGHSETGHPLPDPAGVKRGRGEHQAPRFRAKEDSRDRPDTRAASGARARRSARTRLLLVSMTEGGLSMALVGPGLGAAAGLWVWSGAHVSIAPSVCWDLTESERLVRRCMSKMSRQAARRRGAPAGAKGWLVVSVCQTASVSVGRGRSGRPWAALAAESAFGVLVALGVVGVFARVRGGLEELPAQVLRAVLGDRAARVDRAGLLDARTEAGVAAQRGRRGEP